MTPAFPDMYMMQQQKHVQDAPHFVQHVRVQQFVHNAMIDFT